MSDPPRSFIQTNNDAARLFQAGKYEESTAMLEKSLKTLRSKLSIMPPPPESEPSLLSRHRNKVMIQGIPLSETINSFQRDNSTGVTFFDRQFFLLVNGNGISGCTEDDCYLLGDNDNECKACALVLYNMGVSHHLAGLVQGGSNEELTKAFKVYQMSLEFLQVHSHSNKGAAEDHPDSVFLVLSMALMNNIAHIQSSWFNHDETAHCIQWLRDAASHMDTSLLRDNDFMFFFLRYYAIPTSGIFSSPAA